MSRRSSKSTPNKTDRSRQSIEARLESDGELGADDRFEVIEIDCEVSRSGTRSAEPRTGHGKPLPGLAIPSRFSSGQAKTRKIFPDGVGRSEVTDPKVEPFRKICRLEFRTPTTPASQIAIGTGWLISPTVVITAGHCVYDGGPSTEMVVYPGVDDSDSSPQFARATRLRTLKGWRDAGDDSCDFGAILLDRELNVGQFEFAEFSESDLEEMVVNVVGYPSDKPSRTMWMQSGRMVDADDSFLYYTMDTMGGQSGCPVILWEDGNDFTVVGIHTGHIGRANRAVRINATVFRQLMEWRDGA